MHLWVPPIASRKNCGPQAAQKFSRPHYRLNGNKIIRGGRYWNFSTIFGRMHLWVPPISSRKNCGPQAAQKLSRSHYRYCHHNRAYQPLLVIFIYMISDNIIHVWCYIHIYIYTLMYNISNVYIPVLTWFCLYMGKGSLLVADILAPLAKFIILHIPFSII